MSTDTATIQTAAPGTPGSEPTPLKATAKSMIGDAFKQPVATSDLPATKEAAPAEKTVDKPVPPLITPKHEPILKPKEIAAPPAEPAWVGDKLELPANASKEQQQNFGAMKAKMKEEWVKESKARADAEARLAVHATASPAEQADVSRIKAEHKAAMDRLAVLDLQAHPDFTRQYVIPKKTAVATATEVLAYNGKEGIDLNPLLGKPMKEFNAAVSEFTKDMNSADSATVATSLREARSIHANEQMALSKSSELHQQLQAKSAAEQKQAFESVSNEVIPNFLKREITPEMSADQKAQAESYNQSVDGIRQRAESRAFGKVTERDVATMAFKEQAFEHLVSHAIPALERYAESQNAVIAELTEKLQSLEGKRGPGVLSGDPKADGGKQPTIKEQIGSVFKR